MANNVNVTGSGAIPVEAIDNSSVWRQVVTLSQPSGAATDVIGILTETAPASDTASSGLNGRLQRIAQRITSLIALVPSSLGGKTAANSFSVTIATDDAIQQRPGTGTNSSVSASTSAGTLIASNSSRKGATIENNSTSATLYVLLSGSGTVSSTVKSLTILAGSYYEVPFGYTGRITGVWASATGFASVTEFT